MTLVNVIAGLVCCALAVNFFRLAVQTPGDAAVSINGAAKCQPSGELMGLSKDDLLSRCGEPRSINHQMIGGGQVRKEQWSYLDPVFYVYLGNDHVESIQYAENGRNFEWKN